MDRRNFIAGLTAAMGFSATAAPAEGQQNKNKSKFIFGCTSGGSADEVEMLAEAGFDYCEIGVERAFNPRKGNVWWKNRCKELKSLSVPLLACNGFIPGSFRLTGQHADFAPALDYAEIALRRAEEAGVKYIVFGSGGARNVPGDITGDHRQRPDTEKGTAQFAEFCKMLCERVGDLKSVSVVIEPLRPKESNIVNYVWQGQQICNDVGSPRLNLLADVYHMMMGRESPESITKAGRLLKHCHVANYGNRLFPGSDAEGIARLKPYFDALRSVGYQGGISCECGWGPSANRRRNYEIALKTLKSL